jgi:hypothetical protein
VRCEHTTPKAVAGVNVWRADKTGPFWFSTGMSIDADGAPNAYNAEDKGIDRLRNAGDPKTGRWWGLAKGADGKPCVQAATDPFPNYYVSATALEDASHGVCDPARYVDATKIPFVVLPGGSAFGASLGDLAYVRNEANGKSSFAIYADVGPPKHIGEGSVALAEALGVASDPRKGGAASKIAWIVFPGTGTGAPLSAADIQAKGAAALEAWGGEAKVAACLK